MSATTFSVSAPQDRSALDRKPEQGKNILKGPAAISGPGVIQALWGGELLFCGMAVSELSTVLGPDADKHDDVIKIISVARFTESQDHFGWKRP